MSLCRDRPRDNESVFPARLTQRRRGAKGDFARGIAIRIIVGGGRDLQPGGSQEGKGGRKSDARDVYPIGDLTREGVQTEKHREGRPLRRRKEELRASLRGLQKEGAGCRSRPKLLSFQIDRRPSEVSGRRKWEENGKDGGGEEA